MYNMLTHHNTAESVPRRCWVSSAVKLHRKFTEFTKSFTSSRKYLTNLQTNWGNFDLKANVFTDRQKMKRMYCTEELNSFRICAGYVWLIRGSLCTLEEIVWLLAIAFKHKTHICTNEVRLILTGLVGVQTYKILLGQ